MFLLTNFTYLFWCPKLTSVNFVNTRGKQHFMKAVLLHSYTRHSKQTNQSTPKHQQQQTSLSFPTSLTGPVMYSLEWLLGREVISMSNSERTGVEALWFCLPSFISSAKHARPAHNMGSLAKNYRFEPMTSYKHGSWRSYPLILTFIHYFLHSFSEKNMEIETSRLRCQSQKSDCFSDEVYDMAISLIFITCSYFHV